MYAIVNKNNTLCYKVPEVSVSYSAAYAKIRVGKPLPCI